MDDDSRTAADTTMTPYSADASGGGTSTTPYLTDTPRNLTTDTPRNLTTESPLSPVDATPRLTNETPLYADATTPTSVTPYLTDTPRNLTTETPLSPVDATPRLASTTPYSGNATSGPTGGTSGGAAGSGFAVDPSRYRAAVSPLLAAVEQLTELSTGMTAFLSTMEGQAPWGNDDSGKKFADGDKGYLKYSADTMKTLNGMPDGLKYVADGLKAMADGYEGADGSVQGDLNNADTPAQQSAPLQPMETTVSPILPREPLYRTATAQDRTPVNGKG